jgi:mycofactocin precursor
MKETKEQDIKTSANNPQEDTLKGENDIFSTTEITIEEMAIDGICGVY